MGGYLKKKRTAGQIGPRRITMAEGIPYVSHSKFRKRIKKWIILYEGGRNVNISLKSGEGDSIEEMRSKDAAGVSDSLQAGWVFQKGGAFRVTDRKRGKGKCGRRADCGGRRNRWESTAFFNPRKKNSWEKKMKERNFSGKGRVQGLKRKVVAPTREI